MKEEEERKAREAAQQIKEAEERRVREAIEADRIRIALEAQLREIEKNAQRYQLQAQLKTLDADHEQHHKYLIWHKTAIKKSSRWTDGNGKKHKHSDGITGQTKYIQNNRVAYNNILNQLHG